MAVVDAASARDAESTRERIAAFAASPWALVTIMAVVVVAYAPAFAAWFSGDDFWFLKGARESGLFEYTFDSFTRIDSTNEFNRYRPLYPIAWRWQYAAFGMNALPYHAVVLGGHLACCALVWLIARRLLRPDWTASLATLIFAVHPANADTVAWISGNRVFSTLPFLAALLLFMRWRDETASRREIAYVSAVACYVVAVLMHSSTVMLFPVVVAYGFFVAGEPRDALRVRNWLPYVPFALVAAGTAIAQLIVRDELDGGEDAFRFGWHQYSIIANYLGLLLGAPESDEASGVLGDAFSVGRGLSALVILGAVVALIAARPMHRVGLFLAFWMFAAMLPDSTLLFTVSGRVLYLATVPLAIGAVYVVVWLIDALDELRFDARQIAIAAGGVIIAGALGLTMARADDLRQSSTEEERFAIALRDARIQLPPAGVLYVEGAPRSLSFVPTWMPSLAQLYYPGHEVRTLTPQSEPEPDDRVFRYRR